MTAELNCIHLPNLSLNFRHLIIVAHVDVHYLHKPVSIHPSVSLFSPIWKWSPVKHPRLSFHLNSLSLSPSLFFLQKKQRKLFPSHRKLPHLVLNFLPLNSPIHRWHMLDNSTQSTYKHLKRTKRKLPHKKTFSATPSTEVRWW